MKSSSKRELPRVSVRVVGAVFAAFAVGSCFSPEEGLAPPTDALYFPTSLVVSPGGNALYVTNSDFDLQYNGGTVALLDLKGIRGHAQALDNGLEVEDAASACNEVGLSLNSDSLTYPGPCSPLAVAPFIRASANIGAFASGAILVHRPDGAGARLFVPVRGDPSITYFDVSDDRPWVSVEPTCNGGAFCLDCGQSAGDPRCPASHRIGEDPEESVRRLELPVEPIGIAATEAGDALITAHQTEQAATLTSNPWAAKPSLDFTMIGLAPGPNEVVAIPGPKVVSEAAEFAYQPGFLVSYRGAAQIDLLRFYSDELAQPPRPFLVRVASFPITTNAGGDDERGMVIDASARNACETGCEGDVDTMACLVDCAGIPLRLFVASRSPASLLVGEIKTEIVSAAENVSKFTAFDTVSILDTVPLGFGPSRLALGNILGEDGAPHLRVFAIAFDSRSIFSYDPDARRVDAIIRTGRGPHSIAFELGDDGGEAYAHMYVGHFTDSYIGVVNLDMRKPRTFGSMFATIGVPAPPRESR